MMRLVQGTHKAMRDTIEKGKKVGNKRRGNEKENFKGGLNVYVWLVWVKNKSASYLMVEVVE